MAWGFRILIFNEIFDALESPESWFTMDEKTPVAFAKVEIVEAADFKPSDLNGWFFKELFMPTAILLLGLLLHI